MEDNGGKSKACSKAQPAAEPISTPSSNEGEGLNNYSSRVKQRNRIASSKFRIKKREDEKKLKTDEEDVERVHHDLSGCVSDLILQIDLSSQYEAVTTHWLQLPLDSGIHRKRSPSLYSGPARRTTANTPPV